MDNLTPEQRRELIAARIQASTGYSPEYVAEALSQEPDDSAPYADDLIKKKKNGKSNK